VRVPENENLGAMKQLSPRPDKEFNFCWGSFSSAQFDCRGGFSLIVALFK
jgi:hypothetical protein